VSGKQLLRLAVILGVLLLIWGAAALARRRGAAPRASDAFHLPPITRSQVDTVLLARSKDTTVLARKDTSTWTVDGHPAAPRAIADLFNALADSGAGSELVAERRGSQAGLGVDSAGGTRVRFRGHGKTLADLVVGHRSSDFSGGYVRRPNQDSTFLVHGRLVEVLSRSSDEWRDHRIAAVPKDSVASVEISRGARRYVLRQSGRQWVLAPGGSADSARVADLMAAYTAVDASGFASPAQVDSAHFGSPDRRARLLRKNGTPILTLLFDSTTAGFWVRPDTGKTVYKVESWTADRLTPADSTLRVQSKTSKKKTSAPK
jgi:hypothetical protein